MLKYFDTKHSVMCCKHEYTPTNLKELIIHNSIIIKNENSLNLSSLTNLKKLYIKFINSIDIMSLPNSLENLECRIINPENFPIKFPDSIKKLKISISEKHNFIFPSNIQKLKIELQRLNSLGGFDKIVPNEGLVFVYNGNTYKLTGAFAPLNQILGIFKFSR